MKKQKPVKPKPDDQLRITLRMSGDVWREARHAALDEGIPFGRYVEAALAAYKGSKP